MPRKKGRSKGGGPGGDHGNEDDDATTDEDLPLITDKSIEKHLGDEQTHDKAQPSSPRCPHVGKAVNVPAIKKALQVFNPKHKYK